MGGLFSSEAPRRPAPRISQTGRRVVPRESQDPWTWAGTPVRRPQPSSTEWDRFALEKIEADFRRLSVAPSPRSTAAVVATPAVVPEKIVPVRVKNWFLDIEHQAEAFRLVNLDASHPEYIKVRNMVTNKGKFKIDMILKVDNPYLQRSFELRKQQRQRFEHVEERLLFHGTKRALTDTICTENFDWRKTQKHKFGHGVSFSPNSTYASNYCDKPFQNRQMVVARVLIGESCVGSPGLTVPPSRFDTTHNQKGTVIVKYEDTEYYPAYIIKYHLTGDPNLPPHLRGRPFQKSPQGHSPTYQWNDYEYSYD